MAISLNLEQKVLLPVEGFYVDAGCHAGRPPVHPQSSASLSRRRRQVGGQSGAGGATWRGVPALLGQSVVGPLRDCARNSLDAR